MPRPIFSAHTAAAISVAAFAIVGCGGGGGGGSNTPDTTPPNVVATDPSDNALGVLLNDAIIAIFDESIDPASVSASTFVVRDDSGVAVNGAVTASGRTAHFKPAANALIKSALYQATVSGVRDAAGNALAADFVWNFTTTTDLWMATTTSSAPTQRFDHTAIWTGSEMIVWGGEDASGQTATGGRYRPDTDAWTATTITNTPAARTEHSAVWTGTEMIVWGGNAPAEFGPSNTGGRYVPSPAGGVWTDTAPTTTLPRFGHTAVWTGNDMIVWGGNLGGGQFTDTGGRFNPSGIGTWSATNTSNAPPPREGHTAVWTGVEMIVWGGRDALQLFGAGGRYRPATNAWLGMSTVNAPTPRTGHSAVWTGVEMIIWGGGDAFLRNTGARYNPTTNTWTLMTTENAPTPRSGQTAIWTGSEMIIWGGDSLNQGHAYKPSTDTWRSLSLTDAPTARDDHTSVWTGNRMIVWGGIDNTAGLANTGSRYTP